MTSVEEYNELIEWARENSDTKVKKTLQLLEELDKLKKLCSESDEEDT